MFGFCDYLLRFVLTGIWFVSNVLDGSGGSGWCIGNADEGSTIKGDQMFEWSLKVFWIAIAGVVISVYLISTIWLRGYLVARAFWEKRVFWGILAILTSQNS